jgi:acyl carrier protein
VINGYGPTENTTFTCCHAMAGADSGRAPIPIGRPVSNTRVHLLDRQMQPVPVGVPGEIYIGGAGLARGYLHRPDLTADRFVPDPFAPAAPPFYGMGAAGARLYRTGDRARWLPDGSLEFLGRHDHQVKIRGFRVELGEVESVLAHHPAVRQVAVMAWPEVSEIAAQPTSPAPAAGKYLAAYVVPDPAQAALTGDALRQFMQMRLPDYMVPGVFVMQETLPLTANGKVDRQALPPPGLQRQPPRGLAQRMPETALEQAIAAVCREVLQLEAVGTYDNFFDLGASSLSLIQIHARLGRVLQGEISLIDLFKYPTVSALARQLERQQDERLPLAPIRERVARRKQSQQRQRRTRQQRRAGADAGEVDHDEF